MTTNPRPNRAQQQPLRAFLKQQSKPAAMWLKLSIALGTVNVTNKVLCMVNGKSAFALAEELGERLKQARLNRDLTQSEVAALAGVARKTVLNAEKGKAQLEIFIAIMIALDLTEQLNLFLPKQEISPLQLVKLQGKKRQRASGRRREREEDKAEW